MAMPAIRDWYGDPSIPLPPILVGRGEEEGMCSARGAPKAEDEATESALDAVALPQIPPGACVSTFIVFFRSAKEALY